MKNIEEEEVVVAGSEQLAGRQTDDRPISYIYAVPSLKVYRSMID